MPLTTPAPDSVFVAPAETERGTGAIAASCATSVVPVKSAAQRPRTTAPSGAPFAGVAAGPAGSAAPTPRGARILTGPAAGPAGRRKA